MPNLPFEWVRQYDNRHAQEDRGVGAGFRLRVDIELRFDLDGMTLVDGKGNQVEYPFLEQAGESLLRQGHKLERVGQSQYRVYRPGDASTLEFRFDRTLVARPSLIFEEGTPYPPIRLSYDQNRLSAIQVDASKRVVIEYQGTHITGAVLLLADSQQKQRLTRYGYDAEGRLSQVEDAYGGIVRYEYDGAGRMRRKTDRRGYSFLFTYDNDNRCIHTRGEDGVEEYRFEYKPLERLTVVTRGDGAISRYHYDEQNSLVQVIDPCGGVTAYLKDDTGRLVAEVDPNGNKSEILYDANDLPAAKRDPLGHVRALPVDPSSHPLSHRVPENSLQWEQGDWPGEPQAPAPGITLENWMPRWLVATWGKDPSPPRPKPRLLTDVQGLPLREERGDGKVRRWALDHDGNLRWYTDFDGRTHKYEYASWNHLLRQIDPAGGVTEYAYNISEQVTAITDAGGTRSDYGYDPKDRLVEVRRHGKPRERYVYDAADNLVGKLDSQGRPLLTFAIAPGNLMKQRILASGDVQDFEYTEEGRLAKAKNHAGTSSFAYDLGGRRITDERDGKGVRRSFVGDRLADSCVLGKFTTKYIQVDATTTIVLDPGGQTQRLRLAGPGLVERCASNDTQELTHYDRDGRCLLKAADGPGLGTGDDGWARRFVYSGEGDLLRRDDNLRGTTAYEHDEAHRLAAVRLPGGGQQRYGYDRAGNLVQAPGMAARIQRGNRLLEVSADQCFYNDRDHLSRREGPGGTTVYQYDSRDLLVGIEGPGLSYQGMHDGLGRRTQKTINGRTWHYYWDTDRLAAEVFPDGRLRVYVYPDAFALVPMLFLDYDSVDADPASGKRCHVYTDHLGCPELVLDEAGKTVWRARIDPYGTAHVDIGADFHQPLRWPGHYFDAETGLHDNRFRTYSPELGRYLQSDPRGTAGGLNLYAYTDNPLRAVDLRGLAPPCKGQQNAQVQKEGGEDKETPKGRGNLENEASFDKAREKAFKYAGMDDSSKVAFGKEDATGTVVEFKGPKGAKVAYDGPHADMDSEKGHDQPHVGWQTGGKQPDGGARGNITYDGPPGPARSDKKD